MHCWKLKTVFFQEFLVLFQNVSMLLIKIHSLLLKRHIWIRLKKKLNLQVLNLYGCYWNGSLRAGGRKRCLEQCFLCFKLPKVNDVLEATFEINIIDKTSYKQRPTAGLCNTAIPVQRAKVSIKKMSIRVSDSLQVLSVVGISMNKYASHNLLAWNIPEKKFCYFYLLQPSFSIRLSHR